LVELKLPGKEEDPDTEFSKNDQAPDAQKERAERLIIVRGKTGVEFLLNARDRCV
jgi:hypothetical protein